jgi:hypothetical protein
VGLEGCGVSPFYVYGLRLKGDREVRYIGETSGPPELRLHLHYAAARKGRIGALGAWLLENEHNVEALKIAGVDTRELARATERTLIALCLRLDHRLFNIAGVPRGTSASDLAGKLGISVPYASQLLSGARKPSLELALRYFDIAAIRLGPLAAASDEEIATLRKLVA